MVCDNRCHTGAKHAKVPPETPPPREIIFLELMLILFGSVCSVGFCPSSEGVVSFVPQAARRERHRNRQDQCKILFGFHFVSSKNFIVLSEGA